MTTITFKSAVLATGASTTVTTVAGDVVLVGTVADAVPVMPSQQTTVLYTNAENPTWTRAILASNEAVTVSRNGSNSVAWTTDMLVQASLLLEESLTWDTFVTKQPSDMTAVAPAVAAFVVTYATELGPLTFEWHESDDGTFSGGHDTTLSAGGDYFIATDGTGLTSTLLVSLSDATKDGYAYRCVATDSAGTPNVVTCTAATLSVTAPA